jgi:parallel beta-helix repeat protein
MVRAHVQHASELHPPLCDERPVMKRPFLFAAFLLLALLAAALPSPARAAQSYDNCTGFIDAVPATVSSQGTWCLRHDLNTAITSGTAITIGANNITIDCNDFKVGGLNAGSGTATDGIYADTRFNATVRHCNVRGFRYGIYFIGGGGHRIEDNNLDSNTVLGIYADSPGSTIRGNRVIDTGGSSSAPGNAYGISVAHGVDVLDNTINGVSAMADGGGNATSYGIITDNNGEASVTGNRVRGLAASGTGTTYGNRNTNSGRLIVRDNDVQGTDIAGSIGVSCTNNQATARDNVIAGFATEIVNCLTNHANLMFTTSTTFTGNLGGLAGADAKCQTLATAAGLKGNYRAYLGATSTSAPSRFAGASGWTRVDGKPMINQIADFGTVALTYPPSLDQTGNDLTASGEVRVWTATNANTSYFGQNCNTGGTVADWSALTTTTMTGALSATNGNVLTGGSVVACALSLHLYCFGIDRAATIP